jgi:hypothetical protein
MPTESIVRSVNSSLITAGAVSSTGLTIARLLLHPIESSGTNKRCQIDLIDMRAGPSGPYNWILTTKDHFDKFVTLWPLQNKASQTLLIPSLCAVGLSRSLNVTAAPNSKQQLPPSRAGTVSRSSILAFGILNLKAWWSKRTQVKRLIRTVGAETGLANWDLALTTISIHSISKATGRKSHGLRFNCRSYFNNACRGAFQSRARTMNEQRVMSRQEAFATLLLIMTI